MKGWPKGWPALVVVIVRKKTEVRGQARRCLVSTIHPEVARTSVVVVLHADVGAGVVVRALTGREVLVCLVRVVVENLLLLMQGWGESDADHNRHRAFPPMPKMKHTHIHHFHLHHDADLRVYRSHPNRPNHHESRGRPRC